MLVGMQLQLQTIDCYYILTVCELFLFFILFTWSITRSCKLSVVWLGCDHFNITVLYANINNQTATIQPHKNLIRSQRLTSFETKQQYYVYCIQYQRKLISMS